jgi:excisionase family DNA binding protein
LIRYDDVPLETTHEVDMDDAGPKQTAVMTVPEAGEMLGLSRGGSYEAAARGEIPTIRIGRLLRVPRIAFNRLLESATTRKPAE